MTAHNPADRPLHAYRAEAIVTSAQQAADDAREEVQRGARKHAEEVRAAADLSAWQMRQEAAALAAEHLADAKRIIDEYCAEQLVRIAALSDQLLEHLETIEHRLWQVIALEREISNMFISLGAAADELARDTHPAEAEQAADSPPTEPAAPGSAQSRAPEATPEQNAAPRPSPSDSDPQAPSGG